MSIECQVHAHVFTLYMYTHGLDSRGWFSLPSHDGKHAGKQALLCPCTNQRSHPLIPPPTPPTHTSIQKLACAQAHAYAHVCTHTRTHRGGNAHPHGCTPVPPRTQSVMSLLMATSCAILSLPRGPRSSSTPACFSGSFKSLLLSTLSTSSAAPRSTSCSGSKG